MIKTTQIFPIIIMALSLGACAVYAINHDFRRAVYWLASAVIIASVTF